MLQYCESIDGLQLHDLDIFAYCMLQLGFYNGFAQTWLKLLDNSGREHTVSK